MNSINSGGNYLILYAVNISTWTSSFNEGYGLKIMEQFVKSIIGTLKQNSYTL